MKCSLTPMRRQWLEALADGSERPWSLMPKRGDVSKSTTITVSNRTWDPMVQAGWITSDFRLKDGKYRCDWWFAITDEGRKQLQSR